MNTGYHTMCDAGVTFQLGTVMTLECANGASVVTALQIQTMATYIQSFAHVGSLQGTVTVYPPMLKSLPDAGFPLYVYPIVISFPAVMDGVDLTAWVDRCGVAAAQLDAVLQSTDAQNALLALANDAAPRGAAAVTSVSFTTVQCTKRPGAA